MNTPARGNRYMLIVIVYQFALSFVLSLCYRYGIGGGFMDSPYFSFAGQWLVALPPFICYLLFTRQKTPDALPLKGLSAVNLGLIIGMCVTVQPVMMLLSALSSLAFPNNVSELMDSMQTAPLLFTLLAYAVTPAICEELTFRGVILTNYKNMDIKKAALVNGFFFGIMHFDLQQFLYAFMMGVVFAYFVHYSQSLYASIVAHLSVNGIQIVESYWARSLPDPTAEELRAAEAGGLLGEFLFIIVLTAIFLPVFVILFRSFVSLNKRRITDGQIYREVFLRVAEDAELVRDEMGVVVDDVAADEIDVNLLKAAMDDAEVFNGSDEKKAPEKIMTPSFWGVVCIFVLYTGLILIASRM